jgi:hypothetical protein
MAVVDNFTDSDNTLLPSHTPDTDTVGNGWVKGTGDFDIDTNKAALAGDQSATWNNALIDTGISDYDIFDCDVTISAVVGSGVIARASASNDNLEIYVFAVDGKVYLVKNDGGSRSVLTSGGSGYSGGGTYTFGVVTSGTSIIITIDDVEVINTTDAFNQTDTSVGPWTWDIYGDGRWDNLNVGTDVSVSLTTGSIEVTGYAVTVTALPAPVEEAAVGGPGLRPEPKPYLREDWWYEEKTKRADRKMTAALVEGVTTKSAAAQEALRDTIDKSQAESSKFLAKNQQVTAPQRPKKKRNPLAPEVKGAVEKAAQAQQARQEIAAQSAVDSYMHLAAQRIDEQIQREKEALRDDAPDARMRKQQLMGLEKANLNREMQQQRQAAINAKRMKNLKKARRAKKRKKKKK